MKKNKLATLGAVLVMLVLMSSVVMPTTKVSAANKYTERYNSTKKKAKTIYDNMGYTQYEMNQASSQVSKLWNKELKYVLDQAKKANPKKKSSIVKSQKQWESKTKKDIKNEIKKGYVDPSGSMYPMVYNDLTATYTQKRVKALIDTYLVKKLDTTKNYTLMILGSASGSPKKDIAEFYIMNGNYNYIYIKGKAEKTTNSDNSKNGKTKKLNLNTKLKVSKNFRFVEGDEYLIKSTLKAYAKKSGIKKGNKTILPGICLYITVKNNQITRVDNNS
ncbi:hypothetical protein lbkm_1261 [Lachnospiraceae bacterium KM106-2]|nr:hypothetical protein lbkm_1261 [Lachnospiraceae bacterium KM106-2]